MLLEEEARLCVRSLSRWKEEGGKSEACVFSFLEGRGGGGGGGGGGEPKPIFTFLPGCCNAQENVKQTCVPQCIKGGA